MALEDEHTNTLATYRFTKNFSDDQSLNLRQSQVALNSSCTILAVLIGNKLHLIRKGDGDSKCIELNDVAFTEEFPCDSTCLEFLEENILCVGFSDGKTIAIDTTDGIVKSNRRYQKASVRSIRSFQNDFRSEGTLAWILYDKGFLISVYLEDFLNSNSYNYSRYKFINQSDVHDFVVIPTIHPLPIVDSSSSSTSTTNTSNNPSGVPFFTVFVSGSRPSTVLSVYQIGGQRHFENFNKLASYVKEQVSSVVTRSVGHAVLTLFGVNTTAPDFVHEERLTSLTSLLDFGDAKRKVQRLSLSFASQTGGGGRPGGDDQGGGVGRYLAACDSLGRVLLYDVRLLTVIRMWKGVRDGYIAWMRNRRFGYDNSDSYNGGYSAGYIAIYAPRTGLVNVYKLRHGPHTLCIPVGKNAHIFTLSLHCDDTEECSETTVATVPAVLSVEEITVSTETTETELAVTTGSIFRLRRLNGYEAENKINSDVENEQPDEFNIIRKEIRMLEPEYLLVLDRLQKISWVEGSEAEEVKRRAAVTETVHVELQQDTLAMLKILLKLLLECCTLEVTLVDNYGNYNNNSSSSSCAREEGGDGNCDKEGDDDHAAASPTSSSSHSLSEALRERVIELLSALSPLPDILLTAALALDFFVCKVSSHSSGCAPHDHALAASSGRHRAVTLAVTRLIPVSIQQKLLVILQKSYALTRYPQLQLEVEFRSSLLNAYQMLLNQSKGGGYTGGYEGVDGGSSIGLPGSDSSSNNKSGRGNSEARSWLILSQQQRKRQTATTAANEQQQSIQQTPSPDNNNGSSSNGGGDEDVCFPVFRHLFELDANSGQIRLKKSFLAWILEPRNRPYGPSHNTKYHHRRDGHSHSSTDWLSDVSSDDWKTSYATATSVDDIPCQLVYKYLTFLCRGMLMDTFSVHTTRSILEKLGFFSDIEAMQQFFPLLFVYMETIPEDQFIRLLDTPPSICAFRRWLRDELVDMQKAFHEERVNNSNRCNSSLSMSSSVSSLQTKRKASVTESSMTSLEDIQRSQSIKNGGPSGGSLRRPPQEGGLSAYKEGEGGMEVGREYFSSFDSLVKFALDVALHNMKRSPSLTHNFAIVSIILEIFETMETQLEKRSYGADKLTQTSRQWSILASQLRVCMVLRSRWHKDLHPYFNSLENTCLEAHRGASEDKRPSGRDCGNGPGVWEEFVTVERVERGKVNVYTLLANDTLSFTLQPDQALEHEFRCNVAFQKFSAQSTPPSSSQDRASSSDTNTAGNTAAQPNSSPAQTSKTGSPLVLAWMDGGVGQPLGAGREVGWEGWLELFRLVEFEDQLRHPHRPHTDSISTDKGRGRDRGELGKERGKAAGTGAGGLRRRPLLLYFPHHNKSIPLCSHRALLLFLRWAARPAKVELLSLALSTISTLPILTRAIVCSEAHRRAIHPVLDALVSSLARGVPSHSSGDIGSRSGDMHAVRVIQEFLSSLRTNAVTAGVFVDNVIGLLTLIDPLPYHPHDHLTLAAQDANTSSSSSSKSNNNSNNKSDNRSGDRSRQGLVGINIDENTSYTDWPSLVDPYFAPLWAASSDLTTEVDLRQYVYSEIAARNMDKIIEFADLRSKHRMLLYAIRIDAECGTLDEWGDTGGPMSLFQGPLASLNSSSASDLAERRLQFLKRALVLIMNKTSPPPHSSYTHSASMPHGSAALTSTDGPISPAIASLSIAASQTGSSPIPTNLTTVTPVELAVYNLGREWAEGVGGIGGEEVVRLMHLEAMVEEGRVLADTAAEDLLQKIEDVVAAVDIIVTALRSRANTLFSLFERLAEFGSLLANTDPDALAWVRAMDNSNTLDLSRQEVIQMHLQRELKAEHLSTIQHLLIRAQNRLLNQLHQLETVHNRPQDPASTGLPGGQQVGEVERLSGRLARVDALLSLYESMLKMNLMMTDD